jgi:hypothetical protein
LKEYELIDTSVSLLQTLEIISKIVRLVFVQKNLYHLALYDIAFVLFSGKGSEFQKFFKSFSVSIRNIFDFISIILSQGNFNSKL